MNISTSVPSQVSACIAAVSSELKPAVRAITDCVNAARIRSGALSGPRVAGLLRSVKRKKSVPPASRAAVIHVVMTVCELQRCLRVSLERQVRTTSMITGRPRPPMITAAESGRSIHGSPTNPIKESLQSANPALLYAEIAWKVPSHSARSGGSS